MTLPSRAREFFLRQVAERRSAAFSPAQLRAMGEFHRAVGKRLRAAQDLRGTGRAIAALPLYRQGVFLQVLVVLVSRGESVDPSTITLEAALDRLDALLATERSEPPPELASVHALLLSTDPLVLDRLPVAEAIAKVEALQVALEWLSTLADPRPPRSFKIERIVRLTLTGAAVLAALVWFVIKLVSPTNLALERPVTAVGEAYGTSPAGAVDGYRSGAFGYHSPEHDSPWLAIDLGQKYRIDRVKVFGRSDCCHDQSIPLALEISDDGVSYRQIAERKDPFSDSNPWVVTPQGEAGGYIRLRVERRSYLVLGEVEVYGRKAR